MNRRRLEIEPWRDAVLSVTGELDSKLGGAPMQLSDGNNRRRTLYAFVSRHRLDELLRLFDFPDPNITSASRNVTTVPQQQLFVLNSPFMAARAKALSKRIHEDVAESESARVDYIYQLLFARHPKENELKLALSFLDDTQAGADGDKLTRWEQYALVLLASNEFLFVD